MRFTNFLTNMMFGNPGDPKPAPALIFGRRNLTPEERLAFYMDCAAAAPSKWPENWGDRFLDPEDRKTPKSARSRAKACGAANHVDMVAKQQAIGMESRSFRKARRNGSLSLKVLEMIKEIDPYLLTESERHKLEPVS